MRRRWAIIALAGVAALALALPAAASATWTHKGKGELKETAEVTISGELSVSTEVGKVTCPTSIAATLTGESSSGTVNSYTVSEPSKCDLSESLGTVCGTHGVSKVEKTGAWELTAKESEIEITAVDLSFYFGKCLIPSFRLKGAATATPDKSFAMSTLTLSGSQTLYNSLNEESGTASLVGSPSVSPESTYGVKTAPLVKTAWLMGNAHLAEDGEMTLSGPFSFSYSGGAVSCTASSALSLTSGEVEEEEPEGELESFTVSEPSACTASGTLKSLCGDHPVSSVEKTGAWILNANEEEITITGLALDYKFKECAIPSLRIEGSATLSPGDPIEIREATFGGAPSVFNSSEEKVGAAELGGSPSASPWTYALEQQPACEGGGEAKGSPEWVVEGSPLAEPCVERFKGELGFGTAYGGYQCTIVAVLAFEPGNNGEATQLNTETSSCEGFVGFLEGCELTADSMSGKPWDLEASSSQISVSEVNVYYEFDTSCYFGEAENNFPALTLTPNPNPGKVDSLEVSGEGTARIAGQELECYAFGTLEAVNYPGLLGIE